MRTYDVHAFKVYYAHDGDLLCTVVARDKDEAMRLGQEYQTEVLGIERRAVYATIAAGIDIISPTVLNHVRQP